MASSLPLHSFLSIFFFASIVSVLATTREATSTVAKDLVPCTMCTECENPCQHLPSPPPPVVECPPPPSPPPPSPPPPSPRLPPAIVECPPPPKTPCPDNCETPQGPPQTQYPPVVYFPPGTPYQYYVPGNEKNSGRKMKPFQGIIFSNYLTSYSVHFTKSLIYVACISLPYYVFI